MTDIKPGVDHFTARIITAADAVHQELGTAPFAVALIASGLRLLKGANADPETWKLVEKMLHAASMEEKLARNRRPPTAPKR